MAEFRISNLVVHLCRQFTVLCDFTEPPKLVDWCERFHTKIPCLLPTPPGTIPPPTCHQFLTWVVATNVCLKIGTKPVACEVDTRPPTITCLAGSETIIIDTRTLVINPEQVEHVREQLNDVLSVVAGETRMAALQTRKQADMLENELEAALKEVQKIKQGLK